MNHKFMTLAEIALLLRRPTQSLRVTLGREKSNSDPIFAVVKASRIKVGRRVLYRARPIFESLQINEI